MCGCRFSTRLTVARLTPAAFATSRIVTRWGHGTQTALKPVSRQAASPEPAIKHGVAVRAWPPQIGRVSTWRLWSWGLWLGAVWAAPAGVWEPVALCTAEAREVGPGGEGGQWPLALAADPVEGRLVLYGTDVGGIHRSEDGGRSWAPANIGSHARGACAFAIDPANRSRVLMVGCNSLARREHGLYLSTDGGQSWRPVFPYENLGYRDTREQIAFDPSSAMDGRSRIAYWSAESAPGQPARIYRSGDGGETWRALEASRPVGPAVLKVNPANGWLYAGGGQGLFRSQDAGISFEQILPQPVEGLDLVSSRPGSLWVAASGALLRSDDGGATFQSIGGLPGAAPPGRGGLGHFKVSPADPSRMVVSRDEGEFNWVRYYSHDAGKSWKRSEFDLRLAFFPNNNRLGAVAWHPRDPAVAWSFGGDFATRSEDGGATWAWSSAGLHGVMNGRSFSFNARQPGLLCFPSQDYDAALTTDSGRTWKRLGFSGHAWGGFTYGAYAASPELVFAGHRETWTGRTELRITRDGGRTCGSTGLFIEGEPVGYGDPLNPRVVFFGNLRSGDAGVSWRPMEGCRGVLTHNFDDPRELIGVDGSGVMRSMDHGVTWTLVATVPGAAVRDVACDPRRGVLYAASGKRLHVVDRAAGTVTDITARLPADQFGARGAVSVAVDPVNPDIVYACRPADVYLSDASAFRSEDGGESWHILTRNSRQSAVSSGPDGAREALWVRVHPATRHAYWGTSCFGFWRMAPPDGSPAPRNE